MLAAQETKPALGSVQKPAAARVSDVMRVLWSPRQVFATVEDVPRYGWALVILLTCVALIGAAQVETGLVDRMVDEHVQAQIQAVDLAQKDVIERSVLREQIADIVEAGEFERVMRRIGVLVAMPARLLAGALLVAAMLYGVVALTGRKPEWHTLLTITVYASSAVVLGLLVRLGLILHFQTLNVDTSLMPLVLLVADQPGMNPQGLAAIGGLLSAVDFFELWFWWLVVVGCRATSQLVGWRAWLTCGLVWLACAAMNMMAFVASAQAVSAGG
jgi:hypothetical protein